MYTLSKNIIPFTSKITTTVTKHYNICNIPAKPATGYRVKVRAWKDSHWGTQHILCTSFVCLY
jgi:hypothetical protein